MEFKSKFDEQERLLLATLPPMIGAVMAGVGKSGLGTVKEAFASMKAVMEGGKQYPDNRLIGELMAHSSSWEEAKERAPKNRQMFQAKLEQKSIESPEQLKTLLLAEYRQANELLAENIPPQEAQQYKEWVMRIAEQVAAAAKEGGFGGERISKEEHELLQEIQEALQIDGDTAA